MTAAEYCNRQVVIIEQSESVREAVRLMRAHHVGDVVVVHKRNGSSVPVGILTDRDIVLEILADEVDIDAVSIADVMSFELVTAPEGCSLLDAIELMRDKGVRRLPVMDANGSLVGILTLDDILELMAEQMTDVIGIITRQRTLEQKRRRG